MNCNPLISIITITWNAAESIAPTMNSIRQQSFSDFEHIIIDGDSSDNTLAIAKTLATDDLRIYSEKDKGLYDAMNKGLNRANGKYVIFINAGDAFHSPDTLLLYANAARDCDADIVYSDTVIVDNERKIIAPRHLSAPKSLTFKSFSEGMLICHQAFMARKSICPLYNTDFRFSADFDWCIKVIKASRPDRRIALNTIGIDYLTAGTTDKNKFKSLKERYRIMCHWYGKRTTFANHIKFVFRAALRKIARF